MMTAMFCSTKFMMTIIKHTDLIVCVLGLMEDSSALLYWMVEGPEVAIVTGV